jgi:chitinase
MSSLHLLPPRQVDLRPLRRKNWNKSKKIGDTLIVLFTKSMTGLRFSILYLLLRFAAPLVAMSSPHPPPPMVVAYVFPRDTLLQPGQIDARLLTRINYAFANIANGRMVAGYRFDTENFAYLNGLKKENPSLTVLVSVGGWLWSTNFSDVSLTRESRRIFVQSVIDFLDRYDLDGLDVDWEYPGMPGAGHPFRPEDKRNFTALLKDLRGEFKRHGSKTHHVLFLTFAAGASEEFITHTELGKLQKYVDTVNLMAYDYYEPTSSRITGHHAPLFSNPADPAHISADASVQNFEKAGVSAAKILLGVPFYGHTWSHVPESNHGLYQPGQPAPQGYASYAALTGSIGTSGFTRYWDSISSVPYLYDPVNQTFVSYEDPESLAHKGEYVLAHGLAGIMFWDYESDPSGRLLGAVNQALNRTPATHKEAQ